MVTCVYCKYNSCRMKTIVLNEQIWPAILYEQMTKMGYNSVGKQHWWRNIFLAMQYKLYK